MAAQACSSALPFLMGNVKPVLVIMPLFPWTPASGTTKINGEPWRPSPKRGSLAWIPVCHAASISAERRSTARGVAGAALLQDGISPHVNRSFPHRSRRRKLDL